MTTGHRIALKGFRLDKKTGKPVRNAARLDASQRRKLRHGHSLKGNQSSEYTTWAGMINRCKNPSNRSWHRYGGRGIEVCDRWTSFENFLADMGQKPALNMTIERLNTDGNYEPSNCVWRDRKEQCRNKSNNRILEFAGRSMPIAAWAEETGIPARRIWHRIFEAGWTVEEALTTAKVAPSGRKTRSRSRAASGELLWGSHDSRAFNPSKAGGIQEDQDQ